MLLSNIIAWYDSKITCMRVHLFCVGGRSMISGPMDSIWRCNFLLTLSNLVLHTTLLLISHKTDNGLCSPPFLFHNYLNGIISMYISCQAVKRFMAFLSHSQQRNILQGVIMYSKCCKFKWNSHLTSQIHLKVEHIACKSPCTQLHQKLGYYCAHMYSAKWQYFHLLFVCFLQVSHTCDSYVTVLYLTKTRSALLLMLWLPALNDLPNAPSLPGMGPLSRLWPEIAQDLRLPLSTPPLICSFTNSRLGIWR